MEFVTANTWSLLLLIGNPTNIYLSGAFEISFAEYFVHMAIPTVAAGATSLGIMLLMFGKKLKAQINTESEIQKITDKPLMILALSHLIVCIVLLAVSQYTGIEMWLISLGVALSAIIGSAVLLVARRRKLTPLLSAVKGMPFEIIPFVIGMFIIVMALDGAGVTAALAAFIGNGNGVLDYGFASLLSSNLLNNIPMSVLFSKVLAVTPSMSEVYATIVGSNLGAFITPIGALAGIMWSNLVKENNVKLSVGKFVGYGTGIAVPSALASLGALLLLE